VGGRGTLKENKRGLFLFAAKGSAIYSGPEAFRESKTWSFWPFQTKEGGIHGVLQKSSGSRRSGRIRKGPRSLTRSGRVGLRFEVRKKERDQRRGPYFLITGRSRGQKNEFCEGKRVGEGIEARRIRGNVSVGTLEASGMAGSRALERGPKSQKDFKIARKDGRRKRC